MALKDRIQQDMRNAAKEKNSLALSALRMAIAAIKNKEIEVRGEIPDEAVLKLLATMIKQRRESIDLFTRGNRPELAEKESREIAVLEVYLPKALTGPELEALAREAIQATGARSAADIGRVMKDLMPRLAGRADGKAANEVVRRLLSG